MSFTPWLGHDRAWWAPTDRFIYTQIIRSGDELKTGANRYDKEFSHDVIGILANLFTQGYISDAHGLLDRARYVIGTQTQYDDGVWTYPWPWATPPTCSRPAT